MIWRMWSVLLVVVVGGAWLLVFLFSPPPQMSTGTVIGSYRALGLVPAANKTTVSDAIGHDVFEVPKEDAARLEMAMKAMPGMKMEMKKDADAHGGGGVAEGLTVIAQGSAALVARELAEKGLKVDATVTIDMKEWEFSNSMVMGQPGQVIRLKVKNTGNIPHEFMLMSGPAMSAVDYRLRRADWNLLEHEALTEVPFVMPGDSFEMVVQIHRSGAWMYMCMFPYHMQFGMMGMLMTPDMMGKMGGMMGMGGMN